MSWCRVLAIAVIFEKCGCAMTSVTENEGHLRGHGELFQDTMVKTARLRSNYLNKTLAKGKIFYFGITWYGVRSLICRDLPKGETSHQKLF
jgi:hypothetical protein